MKPHIAAVVIAAVWMTLAARVGNGSAPSETGPSLEITAAAKAKTHALLGDAAFELGNYDDASRHYQQALNLQPDLSSFRRAARLSWVRGDARKARWLMSEATKAGDPHADETASCRAELALMSFQTGALIVAEKHARVAFEQAPQNPDVLALMGRIKTARKEYEAAIDYYRRSAEISPKHENLVALGDLYALTGQREQAEELYDRVIALHKPKPVPDAGDAQLAAFYAEHDLNLDEALWEAEKAYRQYKTVSVTDTLAWCYYKKGQYDSANKTIVNALRWKTPDANVLFHAGMIWAKLGDRNTAMLYLYRALNLNPLFHPLNAAVAANTLKALSDAPSQNDPPAPRQGD